jgi:hypothetical protein
MAGAGPEATGEEEAALDRLYSLDPGEFVAARDALARDLRQAGRREVAAEVRRLRRPTLAAWAVDQLARRQPSSVEALLAAGDRLRRAQEEVLAGGDRAALQRASEERRQLIVRLTGEALDLLRQRGREDPETHRADVEATLSAAALDPEVADLLRRGRVARAVPRPAGFGGLSELSWAATGRGDVAVDIGPEADQEAPTEEETDEADAQQLERAREEVARLEQRATEAEAKAQQARERAAQALAEAERLEAELSQARQRAAAAVDEAARKGAAAEAARREADEAAARLRR